MPYTPEVPTNAPASYVDPNGLKCRLLRFLYRRVPFSLKGDLDSRALKPTRPIISCLLCVSNRPAELKNLLEDLLLQRIEKNNFEIVILNDGGGEKIRSVVQRFSALLPIKYLENKEPQRVIGRLRNKTFEMSEGEYILFVDDDTRILQNNFLKTAMDIFRAEKPDVIIPFCEALFGIVRLRYDFIDRFSFGNAGVLYTRDILIKAAGFRNGLKSYEDIELGIRLSILGVKLLKTPKLIFLHPPFYYESMQKPISFGKSVLKLREYYPLGIWLLVFFNALRFLPYCLIPDLRYQQWSKISWGVLLACFKKGEYYYK